MRKDLAKLKVLLLGEGGVGKTSLIRRFVLDQYSDDYIMTIGAKISKKGLSLGRPPHDVDVVLQIWDVFGQRGYGGVHEIAVDGSHGVFLVYDLTRDDTRRAIEDYWMPMVWRLAGKVPMVLVGNKLDLVEDRIRAREYLYYLTQKHAFPGILTSAKTGDHVEEAFQILANKALEAVRAPTKRVALVTPPQEPVEHMIRVADKIVTDFCYRLGGVEIGMPIAKRQLESAGVDVRAPSEESIRTFIDRLSAVERDFLEARDIEANRSRRLSWLAGIEPTQV